MPAPNSNHLPVAANRKVVPAEYSCLDSGISEIFDLTDKTHKIRFTRRPDQWAQYVELKEAGVVLPSVGSDEFDSPHDPECFELTMPAGLVSASSQLEMIARNVDSYSEVFFVLGTYLGEIHNRTGLSPTEMNNRNILDSVLLYNDPSLERGVGTLLAPPFYLELERIQNFCVSKF